MLEIPPVLLVNEDQVQVIPRAELLVDIAERRRQVKAAEEQSYWDRLATDRSTIHNLKLCDRFGFVILVWRCSCRFASDDRKLHVLDLDSNEEEVDLANDNIFEVVSGILC